MSSDSELGSDHEEEQTIAQDSVVTKYKMAGDIVNGALKKVVEKCVAGANISEVCDLGDTLLNEEFGKVFKKDKEMLKGIAFPTCISVNNCICHFSPLRGQSEFTLNDGDVVKIELGGHFDGFAALVGHTIVVGASKDKPVTGRKADLMVAAHKCAEAALRLVKPGGKDTAVTEACQKITSSYDCKPVEGITSFQMSQHEIESDKYVILNPTEGQKKDYRRSEFDQHEVYAIDCLITTGEGKSRREDTRTNVYRHKEGLNYQLKMKASRQFFAEVDKRFGNMAFSLRAFEDEKKARVGVMESVKHDLLLPYDVLYEKEGEFVAQFKFTVLLMPSGPLRVTGLPFETDAFQSDKHLDDAEVNNLLSQPTNLRVIAKKNKKKKRKEAAAAAVEKTSAPVS